jgi:hypothetical protein
MNRPVAGEVTGFVLAGRVIGTGARWITGGTALYPALRQVAERYSVNIMVLHLSAVRLGLPDPLRYRRSPKPRYAVELRAHARYPWR